MSGATLVHLAFFGAGAVAGAVITSTVVKKTYVPAVNLETPPRVNVPATMASVPQSTQKNDVLKFGTPGQLTSRVRYGCVQSLLSTNLLHNNRAHF